MDGESGVLIKPDSADELNDKIFNFSQNPSMTESMGISGRKNIADKITWEKTSETLLEVFTRYIR